MLRIADGKAWSEPADSRDVDCVLILSAYHALLMGYNRVPVWRVIASGNAWAFGRQTLARSAVPHLFLPV